MPDRKPTRLRVATVGEVPARPASPPRDNRAPASAAGDSDSAPDGARDGGVTDADAEAGGAAAEPKPDPFDASVYQRHPAEYGVMPIDGDYKTPTKGVPFHVRVVGLDIHIYAGRRFHKREFEGEGEIVFLDKEAIVREAVTFARSNGLEGVRLGSARDQDMPDPDTFEAWLRLHSYSIQGRLASYFPPIIERLGAIKLSTRRRAMWAVPADVTAQASDGDQNQSQN